MAAARVWDTRGVTEPDDVTASDTPARSGKRTALLLVIALGVFALDVTTKSIVVATIAQGENIRVLGGLVYLTLIRNPGAAFNMATGMTWLLAVIACAVVAFIIFLAPKLRSTPWAVCLGLVLGGAIGNLTDRIFRAPGALQGHVVDFVSVFGPDASVFPAFNVADSGITVGGVVLVLLAVLGHDYDGTRHRRAAAAGASVTVGDDDEPDEAPDADVASTDDAPAKTARDLTYGADNAGG